jgi:hypothetical protein
MIEEVITYHLVTIKMLLTVLIFNLIVSQLAKESFSKIVRIGYFLFWALVSMVIFAGMVLFLIASSTLDLRVIVMLLSIIVTGIIEFKRVKANARYWSQGQSITKSSSISILIEIVLLLVVYFWASMAR